MNILLITADDMNWDAVGAFGCLTEGTTPNLDRLADESMRFNHAHVTIAVCQPSRSALMTGRYPHRNGGEGFYHLRFEGVPILPNLLRQAGYAGEVQEFRDALELWMVEVDDPALDAFVNRSSRQALDDLMTHLAETIGRQEG